MKKHIIIAIGMFISAAASHGQGYIMLGNSAESLIRTNDLVHGTSGYISGTARYMFELFVAPAGTTDPRSAAWRSTGITTANSSVDPGRILSTVAVPIPWMPFPTDVGDTIAVQVIGGDPCLFVVYGTVNVWNPQCDNVALGRSAVGTYILSGPIPPPLPVMKGPFPDPPGTSLIPGFDLCIITEPSVLALGILGCGFLLLQRHCRPRGATRF